jgi:hypothetical protein
MRGITSTVWLLVVAGLVSACNHGARPTTPAGPDPAATRTPAPAEVQVDPAMRPLVDEAIADLARRLAIDRAGIAVLEVRAMVWPDGSLGCPRPGMMYPQVQQDGILIRLRADQREFSYHGGGARRPFLCENPSS